MKRHSLSLPLLGLWFLIVILACNLSSEPPPTVVPRATATPPPTLGAATLAPNDLPQVPTIAAVTNFELLNLLNQVESDRLMIHINSLENFGTRHVNSPTDRTDYGIGAAYNYIRSQFDTIRVRTGNLVVFDYDFPVTWAGIQSRPRNVVAYIQGTEQGAGTIVIGAHYDSITTDPEDSTSLAPGANDNASGVAALIEMARILSVRQHKSTIMFVAFSAEEIGRKGSIAFANGYVRDRGIDVKAMINLDIIGSSTAPNGAVNDTQIRLYSVEPNESGSRQLARSIEFIGLTNGLELQILLQNRGDRENRFSDHLSFSDIGIPAVRFIEVAEDPRRQHNQMDTSDDIQPGYLAKSTRTVLAVVLSLADGLPAPRNIVLRDNGNGTRTLIWEEVPGAVSYVVAVRRPDSLIYDYNFPITTNSIVWDKFVRSEFVGIVVAAKDANGLVGPPSAEYPITQ